MNTLQVRVETTHPWVDPAAVAAGLSDRDGLVCLLSAEGRSIVAVEPMGIEIVPAGTVNSLEALRGQGLDRNTVALISYDSGARSATGERSGTWPDLILARYPVMLVFDQAACTVSAIAICDTREDAEAACQRAAHWLKQATRATTVKAPAVSFEPEASADAYEAAVADVVERIGGGELFQANIARGWRGCCALTRARSTCLQGCSRAHPLGLTGQSASGRWCRTRPSCS